MTYSPTELKMLAQLETELKYGMKNVDRSQEEMALIESLQAKSHTERYGK